MDALDWGWKVDNNLMVPIMTDMNAALDNILKMIYCNCESYPPCCSWIDECVALFNSNSTYRKSQKSKLIRYCHCNLYIYRSPIYTALIKMGMIWRMTTPSAEDRQKQDGTSYKWSDYVHKVASIILGRHANAERIICVKWPIWHVWRTIFN